MSTKKGRLVVVGSGMQLGHFTAEAREWIARSDKVLYCVCDAATERSIQLINDTAESLFVYYGDGKPRLETYIQMVERIIQCVRLELLVVVVFYGHPGIFVYPSHESIRQARDEGFEAKMLPAVSSLDCLFADLGVDPVFGCQLVEATDFLIRRRKLDTSGCVVIWQAGAVGDTTFNFRGFDGRHVPILRDALVEVYGRDFECVVYEAAQLAICRPKILPVPLERLEPANLSGASTIFLPPRDIPLADHDAIRKLDLVLPANAIPVFASLLGQNR